MLVLFACYLTGIKIKKDGYFHYWKCSILAICVFSLEEGLRWGRECDWLAYYDAYEMIADGYDTGHELLFQLSWRLFSIIGFSYSFVMVFCSFLVIFSFCYFFKNYKSIIYLLLPLMIIWASPKAIQFIRWFVGLSVFYIGFRMYLDRKKVGGGIVMLSSVFFHFGIIVFGGIVLLVSALKRRMLHPAIPIAISAILVLLSNTSFLQNFTNLFQIFSYSGIDRFNNYVNDPDYWIEAHFERKTTVVYLLNLIPLYLYMYVYNKLFGHHKTEHVVFYNLCIVGLIIRSISSGIEILDRYSICFDIFFVIASVFSYQYLCHKKSGLYIVLKYAFILSFVIQGYKFCKPMNKEIKMHYAWELEKPSIKAIQTAYEND